MLKPLGDTSKQYRSGGHEKHRTGPVYVSVYMVVRLHSLVLLVNIRPDVQKYLMVRQHPVPIKQKQNRTPIQQLNGILGQFVVQNRRLLDLIGYNKALADILIAEVESSNRKQNR